MYSTWTSGLMCQWIPKARPILSPPPPTCRRMVVVLSVTASSSAYSFLTTILSPWNFSGQWHCSQTSRAGRRLWTGELIGRA